MEGRFLCSYVTYEDGGGEKINQVWGCRLSRKSQERKRAVVVVTFLAGWVLGSDSGLLL